MSVTVDYKCGLCGASGKASYEPEYVNEIARWIRWLHCNRCADYRARMTKLTDQTEKVCISVCRLKADERWGAEGTQPLEQMIRDKLTLLTKRISKLTCAHWRLQEFWDQDFVEQLIDHPDKAYLIVTRYSRHVKQIAMETRP